MSHRVYASADDFFELSALAERPTEFFPTGLFLNPKMNPVIRDRLIQVFSNIDSGLGSDAIVLATSGSTAQAPNQTESRIGRLVVLSRSQFEVSARAVNARLAVTDTDVFGLCLPLFHVGGLAQPVRARLAAASLKTFREPWSARGFQNWVGGVTVVSLVPTQVFDLIEAKVRAPSSMRVCLVGGGRLEQSLSDRFQDLGWPVTLSYGMTECASTVATASPLQEHFHVLDHIRAEVDEGTKQLRLKSPAICSSMIDVFETNVHVRKVLFGDWFTTEDRAAVFPGGHVQIFGRASDVVKVLGELVDLASLERRLREHLERLRVEVRDLHIVAVDDERAQARLILCLESGSSHDIRFSETLNLSEFKGPERISEVIEFSIFPRTALGKLDRAELKAQVLKLPRQSN